MRLTLARSYLFAPGDHEQLLQKVFTTGCDAVVLDLEDSVRESEKARARILAAEVLRDREFDGRPIYVRINPVGGSLWLEDIQAITGCGLFGIRLAKAESRGQILALDQALSTMEAGANLPVGAIRLVPTIETAAGLLAAKEMAGAPRVETMCFGMADFLRDIAGEADELGTATLYAQSKLVLVSRAAGLKPPIASAYTRLEDPGGLRATSEAARRLGFFGRSCIHPKQIPVVHEVFTPSAAAVSDAKAIIAAFEAGAAGGIGALAMEGGQFVDQAIVKRAEDVVRLAESLAHIAKGKRT